MNQKTALSAPARDTTAVTLAINHSIVHSLIDANLGFDDSRYHQTTKRVPRTQKWRNFAEEMST